MDHRPPQSTVYFDRDCGFCQRCVAAVRTLDWTHAFRFVPLQSEEARNLGIDESRSLSQMVLARQGRRWGGWRAAKRIAFRLPLVYVTLFLLLGAVVVWPEGRLSVIAVLAGLAAALSPLGNPAGDAAYRWIARNRHRFPGSTCTLDIR